MSRTVTRVRQVLLLEARRRPADTSLGDGPREHAAHVDADHLLRGRDLPSPLHDPLHAAREAGAGRQGLAGRCLVERRRRAGRGEGRAARGRRVPARPQALRAARCARAARDPAPRAAGHREDAAREGGRQRVRRELLFAERVLVRRDVRGARRGSHPQAVRRGAQERALDRVHRRARRRRHRPRRRRDPSRARSDAEPAARRARRVR